MKPPSETNMIQQTYKHLSGMLMLIAIPACSGMPEHGVNRLSAAVPFDEMSPADLTRAQIRGTGCVWITANGRSIRFAASEERAVVMLRGSFHLLRPAPDAADMFPFTYDRWIGKGMAVALIDDSDVSSYHRHAQVVSLQVSVDGQSSKHAGQLKCGT